MARSAQTSATQVVARLREAGHQAYLVGGCVRDLLLGRTPEDFDVSTSARPEEVLSLFERAVAVGAQFGVVVVQGGAQYGTAEADPVHAVSTEVATFRSDGTYSDGRRPDEVHFTPSAELDVLRRDFTINGLLLDPEILARTGSLDEATLDFVGGRRDLAAKLVRAIGSPVRRFEEDKLRMLRAVRFAARFNFALETSTAAAIRELASKVRQVSRERVRDELTKMLTTGAAGRAFALMDSTGLLQEVLPEVSRMKGVEQPPQYHPEGDVWKHTLLLLDQLPDGVSMELAWGALLHDVGKPPTFRVAPDRIRFDGHVEVGVRIAQEICRRLRFSNAETEQILLLVKNHMRFADVESMKESTLKRFFRLPRFAEHLQLHKMDSLASRGWLQFYRFAKGRFEQLPGEEVKPQLLVTGRDLIRAGYRPGPHFKQMLELAEDAQLEGRIHTVEEGISLIRSVWPSTGEAQ